MQVGVAGGRVGTAAIRERSPGYPPHVCEYSARPRANSRSSPIALADTAGLPSGRPHAAIKSKRGQAAVKRVISSRSSNTRLHLQSTPSCLGWCRSLFGGRNLFTAPRSSRGSETPQRGAHMRRLRPPGSREATETRRLPDRLRRIRWSIGSLLQRGPAPSSPSLTRDLGASAALAHLRTPLA